MGYYRIVWGDDYLDFDRNHEFRLVMTTEGMPGLIVMCDQKGCRANGAYAYHPLPGVTLSMIAKECRRLNIQHEVGTITSPSERG